jgi:hypothetical protein
VKLTFRGTAKEAKEYETERRLEVAKKGVIRTRDALTFEAFRFWPCRS